MTIWGRAGRAAALLGMTLVCSATAPVAAASETATAYGPGGCSDWGQTAVRNWLTGKCTPPAKAATYTHHYNGGGGVTVRGLKYGDGCTKVADRPGHGKFDFKPACDMHDYGFYLMQRGHRLKKSQMNVNEINSWFAAVLYYGECGQYRGEDRDECRRLAKKYAYGAAMFAVWFA
ncbi:MAG: phospholipase A2 [Sporichthyaceae bacterium]